MAKRERQIKDFIRKNNSVLLSKARKGSGIYFSIINGHISQHKCHDCDNSAIYELETAEGIIYVCEDCDENYAYCQVCDKVVSVEDTRFITLYDDNKTCYSCVEYKDGEENG